MATNDFSMTPYSGSGQEPGAHGTGWHQQLAGSGRHSNYSETRWAQERMRAQQGPVPLRPLVSPLQLEGAAQFVQEVLADQAAKRRTERRIAIGVLSAGLIGHALRNRAKSN